jgi:hypothetical protein
MNYEVLYRIELAIALAGLWFLFWEYRAFRVDKLRQTLFNVRDDLFQQAALGKIDFRSNAYLMTRTTLNGMIRFAHVVGFTRYVLCSVVISRYVPKSGLAYRNAINNAQRNLPNDEARRIIARTEQLMGVAIASHLRLNSPPIMLLVYAGRFVRALQHNIGLVKQIKNTRERVVNELEAEAHQIGLRLQAT